MKKCERCNINYNQDDFNFCQKCGNKLITIPDYIDNMSGLDFEEFTVNLLKNNGFTNIIKTKASGDYGIDVIASKDEIKYAIQCKNFSSHLGPKSIQEAYSGKNFYNCHIGVVLTNNYFSENAKKLAKNNNILLWDRDKLKEMVSNINDISHKKIGISQFNEIKNIDLLFNDILNFTIQNQKISASLIQRKFKIGYNRATRYIDLLEHHNIIGSANGSKPREVLIEHK